MVRMLAPLIALAIPQVPAAAGTVDVTVRDAAGKPVANAVVMVESGGYKPAGPIRFPWGTQVQQKDIQFKPLVQIVGVGSAVSFPNLDKVRHHVYSFSKTKKFELKLYGREENRAITFDKPGPVALGCNIHDSMSGFVMVVATPFAAKTDARGHVVLPGVPAGAAQLRVWHPYARARGNELAQPIAVPAGAAAVAKVVALDVRMPTATL